MGEYQKKFLTLFALTTALAIFFHTFPHTKTALAGPTSSNYELQQFSFGTGGTESSTSTNYGAFGITGETSEAGQLSGTNYKANTGLTFTLQANVPPAPTFTNPSNYYNRLKIVLNTGSNAADTTFAIAISTDAFVSETKYVQNDNTAGSTLGSEDWQTYTSWGGASGITIIGLLPNTTYTVKIAAKQGNFTQTEFGPTAAVATINPTLTFDIDVAATDTDTDPPYGVNIGSLTANSVVTASNKIWVDMTTNGEGGGAIYVYGTNTGLTSSAVSYTIASSSANLTGSSEGYGAQSSSTAQSAGGPMQAVAPYNGSSENVGILDTTKRIIFDSSSDPVTTGRVSFLLKAKSQTVTPAANDYGDTLTVIASATF